ncbi:MAG: hypothetical protein ACK4RF_05470 [Cyclobacteriaceae bacterium]
MKNLENIPKKGIYQVPDGYFDRLPGIIQARIAETEPRQIEQPYLRFAFRYALPVILLVTIGIFIIRPKATQGAEEMLASVNTTDLVSYLQDTDITVDQLLYAINIDDELADAIEEEVYASMPLDDLENDIDFDVDTL